jgi:predicted ferric reductase
MSINSDVPETVAIHLPDIGDDSPLLEGKYVSATARRYGTDGTAGDESSSPPEEQRSLLERMESAVTDHAMGATVIFALLLINVILFFLGCAVGYNPTFVSPDTWLRPLGRGFGEILNLNSAIILVPMCHAVWFFLQGTWVGAILPAERLLLLHKFFAYMICVGTLPHAGVGFRILFQVLNGPQWLGWAGFAQIMITGFVATALLVLIVLTSRGCVRRGRHFQLFWITHHFFILFELAMLLHGFQFGKAEYWKYALGPWIVYIADRVYRTCSAGGVGVPCRVLSARSHAGAVSIELERPLGFTFRSGMYATLRCSAVSRSEWHAFTIVSAPADATLLFCIKVSGDWTARLCELLAAGVPDELEMRLRGPFGAPTAFAHQFEHVTLVGGGIGATPFVSVLKDIVAELYAPTSAAASAASALVATATHGGPSRFHARGGGAAPLPVHGQPGRSDSVAVPRALQRALEQQEADARRGMLGASWEAGLLSVSAQGARVTAVDMARSPQADPIAIVAAGACLPCVCAGAPD